MGCTTSKLDDLPAVALCRDRCKYLDEAIDLRFAFAEAHVAYVHSLKVIGASLHNFIEQDFGGGAGKFFPSPKLNLPPKRKGDPIGEEGDNSPHGKALHSHSNSGSHLNFHSDSEDDSDSHSLHHSGHSSPLHHIQIGNHVDYDMIPNQEAMESYPGGFQGGFTHMNYMKKHTTPSVVYQQKPISSETVYYGESSASTSYSQQYPYSAHNSNQYSDFGYPNYGGGGSYYGSAAPPYGPSPPRMQAEASSSRPPPAPPSPPRASAWDFLNPFEGYDKYYSAYTPSRDLKEVREEEGIPDLEDEAYQHEVVKEVHVDKKFVADGGRPRKHSKSTVEDDEEDKEVGSGGGEASLYQTRPSVESRGMEYEVHVVEKKVVDDERSEEHGKGSNAGRGRVRDVSEVAVEIKAQFERASESGNEIAKILEVGKLPYQRKHISSKMLHAVTLSLSVVSSQPSTSKAVGSSSSTDKASPAYLEIEDELAIRTKNLSSTLQKLYLWEKKLYTEVKAEEKMRVLHDRKCKRLKRLDERGAEVHKVDSTRSLIRSLSTKIRIAIQVVDKISVTLNKIRDEELWPQLNELIKGLTRMWQGMLECHHTQSLAVREARNLGRLGSSKKLGDAHLEATLRLEHELLNWTFRFSSWIRAQKGYVRALNNWLMKCLLNEPEETEDGRPPFSPGRIGAPPVFVICNQWTQALDRISEKEVVQSMRTFALSVFQLWEHDKLEMRERMMANKDLERKVRNLDRDDQRIQKEIQAFDKKIILADDGNSLSVSGHAVFQSDASNGNLQGSLQSIFEAMERFTADSKKAYEELLQRSEEEMHAQESESDS
ncbi:hypothetical protein HS088_TW22G00806 [Tripterygium wilfordii]|uniref:Uncharacterized protein n=1 Tax=Tripterygium wilfordii TaxID=458696 RepID=A0A7J7BYZ4_TRIWF|nr:protein ALTERED PHOSPHATE STARVATION RESPONSE 1-like isoform X2 [Tripterygium wilfordii]KAF5727119.1 hypothetical protein HS088_TW22G00806 [Tripterygium wilfordii]